MLCGPKDSQKALNSFFSHKSSGGIFYVFVLIWSPFWPPVLSYISNRNILQFKRIVNNNRLIFLGSCSHYPMFHAPKLWRRRSHLVLQSLMNHVHWCTVDIMDQNVRHQHVLFEIPWTKSKRVEASILQQTRCAHLTFAQKRLNSEVLQQMACLCMRSRFSGSVFAIFFFLMQNYKSVFARFSFSKCL